MAWNRPSEREQGIGNREQGARKSPFRGLVAGAVVVLGAGIAAWLMWPDASAPVAEDGDGTKKDLIKDVVSVAAPTNAPVEKKYSEMTNDEKLKYWKDKYGDNPPPNIKPIVYFLENPPQRHFKAKESPYKIFRHSSERHIAALLSVRPGNWMMRPPHYDEKFDIDFAAALSEPIEITADDTEEQRALKKAVIDTKAEIAERAKKGENPSDIMNEAGKELFNLGQLKRDLEIEVGKVRRDPNASDDDYSTIVEAANKMLEAKGLPPVRSPSILERQYALKCQAERARKNQQKKGDK